MSLADLIRGKPKNRSVGAATATVATPATDAAPNREAVATVAGVAVAIPQNRKSVVVAATCWRLHFADRDDVRVTFSPAVERSAVLAAYPDAVAAEPVQEATVLPLPADLTTMVDSCIGIGLYGDEDRAALPTMFALDPDGTRGLIEAMHSRIGHCRRCRHFRRPGLSDGYCVQRADLRHVYGAMRALPGDAGAHCRMFDPGGE